MFSLRPWRLCGLARDGGCQVEAAEAVCAKVNVIARCYLKPCPLIGECSPCWRLPV
ncbi:hypothetical protein SBA3_990010 [Candidatus Sulfopaludibacter sp. SbA3]|nr:hypothetical protein SBA3_990010 [Candidatus Sulfopaludibacter sp. SbA3]